MLAETPAILELASGSIDSACYPGLGRGLHAQAVQQAGLGLGAALRDMGVAMISPPRRSPKSEDSALEYAPAT